jgi:signal transduction histidine kinase
MSVSEALLRWTRPHERLQLDEIPGVLLVVAVSLIWFSSRRYFEANRRLRLRTTVEARLAEALAENQRLAQQYVDIQEHERKALARDLHDDLGVAAALEHCVGEWRSRLPGVAIEMSIEADLDNLDETRGLVIYRLVQEALTNIARHSQATKAEFRIACGGESLRAGPMPAC